MAAERDRIQLNYQQAADGSLVAVPPLEGLTDEERERIRQEAAAMVARFDQMRRDAGT